MRSRGRGGAEASVEGRRHRLKGGVKDTDLPGAEVILTGDGIASGCTRLAAARACRRRHALRVIIAVPAVPSHAIRLLALQVDEICRLNIRSGPVFAFADASHGWRDFTQAEVPDEPARAEREGPL